MKILIVKVSALGDVVHALPVLAYLHATIPNVEVDWLVESGFAPLLEDHPLIRQVICIDTKQWRKQGMLQSVRGAWKVCQQLQEQKYDVALDLQGNSKSGFFTRMCGAAERFGFDRSQVREWPNLLSTNRKVMIPPECHYISSRYLQIAKVAFPGNSNVPLCGPLAVEAKAGQVVAEILGKNGLVPGGFLVAHYGTTWETKLWPLDLWLELAEKLTCEDGQRIVLTWGNDVELRAAQKIAEVCQGRAVIWPLGTLKELVALLAAARLVIGADTGPIHIAAAIGTPTVSIFRVTDRLRTGPPGDKHVRLQADMDCSPCFRKSCYMDTECGISISVDSVYAGIRELLSNSQFVGSPTG